MPKAPWSAIEANPEIYIDPKILPQHIQLCSLAKMEIAEVWAWIGFIQRGKSAERFCFYPRDNIARRLEAQMSLSAIR
jgi:hypothetical protein